jgi:hypothetical protein
VRIESEVARLIDEAIARNPVPFAVAGRESVIIRSTSAKKRRQGRPALHAVGPDKAAGAVGESRSHFKRVLAGELGS